MTIEDETGFAQRGDFPEYFEKFRKAVFAIEADYGRRKGAANGGGHSCYCQCLSRFF
jgi:hypothetical protein